jgi:hypothetical protein
MKTVLPSRWAFVLFSLYLFGTAVAAAIVAQDVVRTVVAALVSFLLTWVLPFEVALSPDTLWLVAAAALVPLVLAPIVGYRYAIRRFDRYTLA